MNEYRAYSAISPWYMLGLLLVIQILVALIGRGLAPLGVLIGEDLSLTKTQIGLLPSALFLGQTLISLPAGFVTDRIGSKRMLLIVIITTGIAFIAMTFISLFSVILIMIAIGGVGYGAAHPATNRGIIYWFPQNRRGMAMGIKQMGVTVGSALAALLLLPLANIWGWRTAYFSASLLLIVAGLIAYSLYKDPPGSNANKSSEKIGQFYSEFVSVVKYRALVLISSGASILNGSQMILNTYLVLFAYEVIGLSLILSGLLLVISEIGGSLGRITWGMLSDLLFKSDRIVILMIIALLTAGIATVVAFVPVGISFFMIAPIIFCFGFCVSGFNAIWMNAATEIVPHNQSGMATGFSITVGSLGVIIGPPLFGLIVDTSGTFTFGWLFIAALMFLVMTLLIIAKKIVKKEPA